MERVFKESVRLIKVKYKADPDLVNRLIVRTQKVIDEHLKDSSELVEEWRPLQRPDIDNRYEVSEIGRVRDTVTGQLVPATILRHIIGDPQAFVYLKTKKPGVTTHIGNASLQQLCFRELHETYGEAIAQLWDAYSGTAALTEYLDQLEGEVLAVRRILGILNNIGKEKTKETGLLPKSKAP